MLCISCPSHPHPQDCNARFQVPSQYVLVTELVLEQDYIRKPQDHFYLQRVWSKRFMNTEVWCCSCIIHTLCLVIFAVKKFCSTCITWVRKFLWALSNAKMVKVMYMYVPAIPKREKG